MFMQNLLSALEENSLSVIIKVAAFSADKGNSITDTFPF